MHSKVTFLDTQAKALLSSCLFNILVYLPESPGDPNATAASI